jgi:hypothetical protein
MISRVSSRTTSFFSGECSVLNRGLESRETWRDQALSQKLRTVCLSSLLGEVAELYNEY